MTAKDIKVNMYETKVTIYDPDNVLKEIFYNQGTSEPIKRILEHFGIKVALKPHQTIGNLFPKPKDHVPKAQIRAPIYKIPCGGCEKYCIGETKRQLATREGEHKKAVKKM